MRLEKSASVHGIQTHSHRPTITLQCIVYCSIYYILTSCL